MEYDLIIVTGASSGLGEAFAQALAVRTSRMVLVARRKQRLEELAETLSKRQAGLQVMCVPCDLADATQRKQLVEFLREMPPGRTLLVNDAGLGDYGEFCSADEEKSRRLLEVNMMAPVQLTQALLPRMLAGGGDIVNIASLAADVFLPDFALYAASKSFLASFSEGLNIELRGKGIRVLAVCPGPVHTEFGRIAQRGGYDRGDMPIKKWFYTPIETVVSGSLHALEAGKARYYPSTKVFLSSCILRHTPLWMLRAVLRMRPRRVHPTDSSSSAS